MLDKLVLEGERVRRGGSAYFGPYPSPASGCGAGAVPPEPGEVVDGGKKPRSSTLREPSLFAEPRLEWAWCGSRCGYGLKPAGVWWPEAWPWASAWGLWAAWRSLWWPIWVWRRPAIALASEVWAGSEADDAAEETEPAERWPGRWGRAGLGSRWPAGGEGVAVAELGEALEADDWSDLSPSGSERGALPPGGK